MLLAVLAVAVSEVHSFDVFWQLQSGKYMSQTHSFIRSDTFTLMQDVPRSEHTWVHSLILYAAYLAGGYGAISVLKGVLVTATMAVLIWTARFRTASAPAIALLAPIYIMTSGGWLERPQLWTFLCFALFVFAMERFIENRCWKVLWLVPLALFWSNAHAGFVLAAAILCAYFVGEGLQAVLEKRFSRAGFPKLIVLATGVFIAGLINPYSSNLLSALINTPKIGGASATSGQTTAANTHVFNMDWTPTTFQQEPVFYYAMAAVVLVFLLGWRRIRLSDLFLMIGLAIMGTKLVRHIPFFYMGMLAICPVYLDQAVEPLKSRLPKIYNLIGTIVMLCIAVGIFGLQYRPTYKVYGLFNTGLRTWHYPIKATEFVREHQLPKNIYNTYDWGGYMEWQLYPDYLVFWDGRQTSAGMFDLGWQVMAGKPDWEKILDKFEVKTIVTRASTIDTGQKYPLLDRLAAHPDWFLVFNSESSMVFVKRGSVADDWLRKYALPKEKMDDTILAESHLMVKYNANRYMAWWEMAQIYTKRKQYKNALLALNQHLARSPRQSPAALRLQKQLKGVVGP